MFEIAIVSYRDTSIFIIPYRLVIPTLAKIYTFIHLYEFQPKETTRHKAT